IPAWHTNAVGERFTVLVFPVHPSVRVLEQRRNHREQIVPESVGWNIVQPLRVQSGGDTVRLEFADAQLLQQLGNTGCRFDRLCEVTAQKTYVNSFRCLSPWSFHGREEQVAVGCR